MSRTWNDREAEWEFKEWRKVDYIHYLGAAPRSPPPHCGTLLPPPGDPPLQIKHAYKWHLSVSFIDSWQTTITQFRRKTRVDNRKKSYENEFRCRKLKSIASLMLDDEGNSAGWAHGAAARGNICLHAPECVENMHSDHCKNDRV